MAGADSQADNPKILQLEKKIAALSAINSALQKENDKLRRDAAKQASTDAEEELEELRHEFQMRLGVSDRTISALQEEKARLSSALSGAMSDTSTARAQLADLTKTVETLRLEGEQWSKRAGDLEATVRKLRSSTKDLEMERDKLQSRVRVLEAQYLEHQQKSESAMQAANSQVEALERELSSVRAAAKKELAEARKEAQDAQLKLQAEAARGGAELVAAARERELAMAAQVQELREALTALSSEAADKEEGLRRQVHRLEDRIREIESEKNEYSANTGDLTTPLLKQIESMAQAAKASQEAAQRAEQRLLQRLEDAEAAVKAAGVSERAAIARAVAAESALASASDSANNAMSDAAKLANRLEAMQRSMSALEAEKSSAEERLSAAISREEKLRTDYDMVKRELSERLWDCEQSMRMLQKERDELLTRIERSADKGQHSNSKQNGNTGSIVQVPSMHPALSQMTEATARSASDNQPMRQSNSGTSDPTATLSQTINHQGVNNDTNASGLSQQDVGELDVLLQKFMDTASVIAAGQKQQQQIRGGLFNGFLQMPTTNPSLNIDASEMVRTVQLLQRRVKAAEQARDSMEEQLFAAMNHATASEKDVQAAQELRKQLQETSRRCDMALEIIGERNERIEQLEEDIIDMKNIFHTQLEICVNQLTDAQSELTRLRNHLATVRESNASNGTAVNPDGTVQTAVDSQ